MLGHERRLSANLWRELFSISSLLGCPEARGCLPDPGRTLSEGGSVFAPLRVFL
ncbi:MAG: hypothetical protein ACP5OS_04505 [Leptospirillia bacterium]